MIKNVIKRLFPKLDTVKEEKILKIFGPAVLQPNLWHINKKSVSRGFAIGAFCAFIPIPGVQMILAAFLSITFAGNLPLSVVLTWISNPFTYALADPILEQVKCPITEPLTDPVTDPFTNPITDPIKDPRTDPCAYPVDPRV